MKKISILTSILTMVLCASLIAGSSFALFTSESKVNVAVTAGTVDVEASILDLELYSPTAIDLNGVITDDKNAATTTFANGGTATLKDGTLTLTNITPGDKVTFAIGIENKSNVSIKYRTILSCDDEGLLNALKINIGGAEVVGESAWTALKANGTIESLPCSVELPATVGNAYQNKSCTITFKIEAVQGNTQVRNYGIKWSGNVATQEQLLAAKSVYSDTDTSGNLFTISTPELLAAYAQYVNEGKGKRSDKVILTADMDLCNIDWTPIGTEEHPFDARVFDGQGHTISNLRINGGATNPTDVEAVNQGLFGYTWTNGNIIEIMNLNICNIDIYAKNSAGAIVGQIMTDQSSYWLAGYTAIHHVNLTGKVTIEGGNSGGISGSGTDKWALQTQYSDIVIDVDVGSYVSNVKAAEQSGDGVGGALGSVASTVAWGRVVKNIQSNLDVIGISGCVGGIIGIGNQYFEEITYTGNVTVKNVTASKDGKYNSIALVTGILAPTWNHSQMTEERRNSISATGTLTIELTDGTAIHDNGQGNSSKFGDWAW